jgi:hypothetical protein
MACQLCRIEGDPSSGKPTEWTVHDGVDITPEEKKRLFDALDAASEDSEQEARNLVLHRFQHLFAIKMQGPAMFEALKAEPTGMKRLNSELRRAMFDWLQAVRAFLDHTETRIKRRYGDDSAEFTRFDEATSQMYDAFFAYRFLYRLRNAQHVDFAAIGFVLMEKVVDGERVVASSARFRRDELLSNFSKWGPVKAELQQFPEDFSMDEHVATMMQCLDYVAHVVAEIEHPYLLGEAEAIKDALSKVPPGAGFPAVFCLPDEGGDRSKIEMRTLFDVTIKDLEAPPNVIGRPAGRGDEWTTWQRAEAS